MKRMNNFYGQSWIFNQERKKIPMNLQFFAEKESGTGEVSAPEGENEEEQELNIEELAAQLAEERARNLRLQNEKDAASTEAANFKRQLRAKMTADEAAQAEKEAAEAAKDARIKELESKFRLMDYAKRYMGIGIDEKSATELAELTGDIADTDKFFSTLDKFIKTETQRAGEEYVQNLIKNGKDIHAGNGDGGKESEAVQLAKESAKRRMNKGFNSDALKQWM